MPLSQILKALSTRPSRRRNRRTSGFYPPVTEREKLQPQPEEGVTPGHRPGHRPRHSGNCLRQPATLPGGTTWHHPRRDGSTSCQGRPPRARSPPSGARRGAEPRRPRRPPGKLSAWSAAARPSRRCEGTRQWKRHIAGDVRAGWGRP